MADKTPCFFQSAEGWGEQGRGAAGQLMCGGNPTGCYVTCISNDDSAQVLWSKGMNPAISRHRQNYVLGVSATGSLRCFQPFLHFLVCKALYVSIYICRSQIIATVNKDKNKTLWIAGAEQCGWHCRCVCWLAADTQLHSHHVYWERSHQWSWERSQMAWSEHYTIYNAASRSTKEQMKN